MKGPSAAQAGDNSDNDEEETEILRINLQSSTQHGKKIPVKTRKTTVAMNLLKHFIRTVLGQEMSEEQIRAKNIRLKCDGEDVPYDMCCADMNDGDGLEDDDCLDVAGL